MRRLAIALLVGCGGQTHAPPARDLIGAAVEQRNYVVVAVAIAGAPPAERPELATLAATRTPIDDVGAMAEVALEGELATACGDRLERDRGAANALAARQRAVLFDSQRAEPFDALARSLAAQRDLAGAVAAWDRASALAPAQPSYRLAPIRAWVANGERALAVERVRRLATAAATSRAVEDFELASTAAALAGEPKTAAELARHALGGRPGDGRLKFVLAGRLVDAGEPAAAADAYVELLVCGAHGRPWHRHEVAARVSALAATYRAQVTAALDAKRACVVVDEPDLRSYLAAIRS